MDQEDGLCSYFACGLDPFPDAEVADDPCQQQTQSQLPAQAAHMLDAIGNLQHSPPAQREGKQHLSVTRDGHQCSQHHISLTPPPEHLTAQGRNDVLQARPSSELQATEVSNSTPHVDCYCSTTSLILHLLPRWPVGLDISTPFI